MTRLARLRRADRGTVTVEFALILPLLLLLVGFLLAAGFYALWSALANAATRDLARYASIPTSGNYPNQSALVGKAKQEMGGFLGTPVTGSPSVSYDSASPTPGEGDIVKVSVTWQIPGLAAFAGFLHILPGMSSVDLTPMTEVTHTATARLE